MGVLFGDCSWVHSHTKTTKSMGADIAQVKMIGLVLVNTNWDEHAGPEAI